jgi:WG containing repeat
MKAIYLLALLFLSSQVMGQLNLPKPAEIERIEISHLSMANWYKPDEMQTLLPRFVATKGTYGTKAIPFQYGKFILKNGKEITWMANYTDSILLYDGKREQLFVLPKQNDAIFPVWDKDGKEGFIDVNGNVVIKPQFEAVGEFSEGLAPVMIGDKWGYINRKGKVLIAPRWRQSEQGWKSTVSPFYQGLAIVIEAVRWNVVDDSNYYAYKCGYINQKGEYVIQPKFRANCGVFSEGLARTEVDVLGDEAEEGKGWIGFIDKKGQWAIKPKFFQASPFLNGFARVQSEYDYNNKAESFYLIDKTGRKVEDTTDCLRQHSFTEGLALIYDEKKGVRFINEQCDEVFKVSADIKPDSIENFSEGLLLVEKEINGNKMFGYLNKTGKVAIDFKFSQATPFSDGLAGVNIKEGDKDDNAYINKTGEIILKNTRGTAPFKNGLAFQYLHTWTISERPKGRNIRGYMNKQGKYVWLSPRAENYLDKDWIKENYIGVK